MRIKRWGVAVGLVAVAASMGTLAWAAGAGKLVMNGNVVSSNVQVIGGQAYVPISDVAKAQGMVVVKTGDVYEIKKAGGATPVAGLQGKVGDVLFDGKWRFTVLGVTTPDSYTMAHKSTLDYAIYNSVAEFDNDTRVFTPRDGRTLMIVKCRVSNGKNSSQALWFSNTDTRTALADDQGESHPPIAYDIEEGSPFQSKTLLPGAKVEFSLVFSVPQGTKVKDLVFTLRTIAGTDRGNDVRVALGQN